MVRHLILRWQMIGHPLTKVRHRSRRYLEVEVKWLLHNCRKYSAEMRHYKPSLGCGCLRREGPANFRVDSKSVHAATRRTLLKIKGFSEIKVEKVKEAIAKCQVSRVAEYIAVQQQTSGANASIHLSADRLWIHHCAGIRATETKSCEDLDRKQAV